MKLLDMKFSVTNRGFERYDFKDFNGEACSLQKSSIAATLDEDVEAIWLGMDHETIHRGQPIGARMHLTRAQVASLLPVLNHFMMTGEVSDDPAYMLMPSDDTDPSLTSPEQSPDTALKTRER